MIEVVKFARSRFGVNMRKAYMLVVVLSISLVSILYTPSVLAPPLGHENKACTIYKTTDGHTESSPLIIYLNSDGHTSGEVKLWDYTEGSPPINYLRITITVWSKPFLAFGEKGLDKNKDGIMDDPPGDKTDIGSDGVRPLRIFHDDDDDEVFDAGEEFVSYKWEVNKGDNDDEIWCPVFTDHPHDGDPEYWGDWGIFQTPIVYEAKILIEDSWGTEFGIAMEVHASPPQVLELWIPEVPFGTFGALVAFFAALGVTAILKK